MCALHVGGMNVCVRMYVLCVGTMDVCVCVYVLCGCGRYWCVHAMSVQDPPVASCCDFLNSFARSAHASKRPTLISGLGWVQKYDGWVCGCVGRRRVIGHVLSYVWVHVFVYMCTAGKGGERWWLRQNRSRTVSKYSRCLRPLLSGHRLPPPPLSLLHSVVGRVLTCGSHSSDQSKILRLRSGHPRCHGSIVILEQQRKLIRWGAVNGG